MFRFYLKKMLISPVFVVSAVLLLASVIVSVWPMVLTDPYVLYLHQYSFHIGVEIYFMPVVCVLPVCLIQNEMNGRHADLYYFARTSKRKYLFSGICGAAVSGMMIMFAAYVLFLILCAVCAYPQGISFENALTTYGYDDWSGFRLYLYSGLIYCLNGIIWPVIAYTVLFCTSNAYIAVSTPFIVRTLIGYFIQHLDLEALKYIDMGHLKLSSGIVVDWMWNGMSYLIGYIAIVVLLCTAICYLNMEKRLRKQ